MRVGGLQVRDVVVRYDAAPGSSPERRAGVLQRRRGRGGVTAVAGVSLDVGPGEVVALLGPSGCGKSSLLRAVAGLEPTAAGSVAWDGAPVDGVPVHQRGFGLMFQDGQLFTHRDVAGNVAYGLAGQPRDVRRARVQELLRLVGLDGYGPRPVATLSGGERQRVALARALAPRPRLLLLDEPLSALDRGLRERLAVDLRDVLQATGTTAVLVTHDQDEAFAVADRVAVMRAGRLRQVGRPGDVWRRPADREVAEFLGYETFVPLEAPAAAPLLRALAAGERAERGVPGALIGLAEGALVVQAGGPLAGTVLAVTAGRGRSHVRVSVPGIGTVAAVEAVGADWQPGARVPLAVDAGALALVPPPPLAA